MATPLLGFTNLVFISLLAVYIMLIYCESSSMDISVVSLYAGWIISCLLA